MKILLVEDSKIIRITIESKLRKAGYKICSTDSCETALELLESEQPKMVITDWMLPGMSGPDLCRHIRQMYKEYYIYVIIITSLDDTDSLVSGLDAGADDFIRKPLVFPELLARIKSGERMLMLEQTLYEQNQSLTALSRDLAIAHTRLQNELLIAGEMQKKFIPSKATTLKGIDFNSIYLPSLHVSGDLLNYFELDATQIAFYAVDVAGHGVAAAMMAFTLSWLLNPNLNRHCILTKQSDLHRQLLPSEVMHDLNQQFQNETDDFLYFTMLYGIIDTVNHKISFCQAGHPHPLFFGSQETGAFIGEGGYPVGLLPFTEYETITLDYAPGDCLLIYSDGLIECANAEREMFGAEHFLAFVQQYRHETGAEFLQKLQKQLLAWSGDTPPDDDVSVLSIRF